MKSKVVLALIILCAAPFAHAKKQAYFGLETESPFFSPNKDGVKDELVFQVRVEKIKNLVSWEAQIADSAGAVRKTFSSTGEPPKTLTWNGLDEFGAAAPEGAYDVALRGWDKKSTLYNAQPVRVVLDLTPPSISINSAQPILPIAQDLAQPATFFFSAADLSGISGWTLQLLDADRRELFSHASTGTLPANWTTPGAAFKAPAGKAVAILSVSDLAGNRGSSPPLELSITTARLRLPEIPSQQDAPVAPRKAWNGATMQLTSIMSVADLFGPDANNQSSLLPQSAIVLDPLADAALRAPGTRIVILGHVDAQPSEQKAKALSSYFAWRVFSHFVKQRGVDKSTVSVKGLGASLPIADNRSSMGRARNRRIEIQMFIPNEAQ